MCDSALMYYYYTFSNEAFIEVMGCALFFRVYKLEEILKEMGSQLKHNPDEFIRLRVRRNKAFQDALWRLKRLKYSDCGLRLKIIFQHEAAIDEGGPTREFFR